MSLPIRRFLPKVFLLFIFAGSLLLVSCGEDETVTDEFSATVNISADTEMVSEGVGNVEATVTLSQENTSGSPVSIPLTISGNATSGSDYEPINTSLTITPGSASSQMQIIIIDDNTEEDRERIVIEIASDQLPDNITVSGNSSVTITISDNDNQITDCPNDNSIDQDNHE